MQKIYFDTCCLNRPWDKQDQARVSSETETILKIMQLAQFGGVLLIASEALDQECSEIRDERRRRKVEQFLSAASFVVKVKLGERLRGQQLRALGFKELDALHIACAERARVEIFLTTDDQIRSLARRVRDRLTLRIENPASWYPEALVA